MKFTQRVDKDREYININPYKPTKRSDSISRRIVLKLAQTFREKLEASVHVITLRLSKNFFDCSRRDVGGDALREERESHVSEAFRRPPFFFPSGGERVRRTATLGLSIYHTAHGGCFHVTMFNYLPSIHRQGKEFGRKEAASRG